MHVTKSIPSSIDVSARTMTMEDIAKRKEYIPASMSFQVFVPVQSAVIFTGELHGTIEERNLRYGGVVPE